mmetsp:Transcript_28441/g.75274  ORF Transcript_28441/g.75274 Transcript_28441/m.75274 type:complete len:365 (-) Transcript_28441:1067-2161(-)
MPDVAARGGVDAGGRLVEGDDLRAASQGDADGELPLHAAAERLRRRVALGPEAGRRQQRLDFLRNLVPGNGLEAAEEVQMLLHGEVLVERVVLEADAELLAHAVGVALDGDAVHANVSLRRGVEARHDRHRRRLARAVVAEEAEDGALVHVEVDALQGALAVREYLLEVADLHGRLEAARGRLPEEARPRVVLLRGVAVELVVSHLLGGPAPVGRREREVERLRQPQRAGEDLLDVPGQRLVEEAVEEEHRADVPHAVAVRRGTAGTGHRGPLEEVRPLQAGLRQLPARDHRHAHGHARGREQAHRVLLAQRHDGLEARVEGVRAVDGVVGEACAGRSHLRAIEEGGDHHRERDRRAGEQEEEQ